VAVLAMGLLACEGGTLDAGSDTPHGLLPVDERNPFLVMNDGYSDNWQGEYALLLGNSGSVLAGIIVKDSGPWPSIDYNLAGWRAMVEAAKAGGMGNVPDPIPSVGAVLVQPADGEIDSTQPNGSDGAHLIIDASRRLSLPYRPLVIASATRMTDIADAYLLDHTVTDRVVVVASLGTVMEDGGGAVMGAPNGEMDPWADAIVVRKFRYVQVSTYYNQTADVPASSISNLPTNAFGAWIASKQSKIWGDNLAADQVSVLAAAVPTFVVGVDRIDVGDLPDASAGQGPLLRADPNGGNWLVTQATSSLAATRFWQMLLDPSTFSAYP